MVEQRADATNDHRGMAATNGYRGRPTASWSATEGRARSLSADLGHIEDYDYQLFVQDTEWHGPADARAVKISTLSHLHAKQIM